MKKIISVFTVLILLCGITPAAISSADDGATYYFDSENGSDSNDGTSENTAWKTLSKACSVEFKPGDRILFKAGGIFSSTFAVHGSGTESAPITVSSYGDTESLGLPLIRSDGNDILMYICDVSHWDISNLEFTAPEGRGLYIIADGNNTVSDISVSNCRFRDIYNKPTPFCDHFPISLSSNGEFAVLDGITISDCSIEDCSYGIQMSGRTREWNPDWFKSPAESYNRNFLIEGVSLRNILNDGIIIGSIYGMTIRNCSLINTSTDTDHYTAPMWSHHADNYIIENCEIAGSTNYKDGMAVDFDGWTTNAVYQYIYSHDNYRFVRNCCYDNYTKNDNCTVRYCLSVNDNKGGNELAQMLSSSAVDYAEDEHAQAMTNFKFYNNTIINGSSFKLTGLKDAIIANNIFVGGISDSFIQMRKNVGDNNEKIISEFNGIITNNCFSGTPVPLGAKNSVLGYPGFVSDDTDDKNSFMLADSSNLIGKGIKIEDDMGKTDFYGNPLTDTHNIGCYEGRGEKTSENAASGFLKTFKAYIFTFLGSIYNFIDNCNNRFWLF